MFRNFQYKEKDTVLHRLHPLTKTFFLIVVVFGALSQHRWYDPLLILLFLVIIGLLTRIPILSYIIHSRILLTTSFFIILIQILVNRNGEFLFHLIPEAVPYIGGNIPVTDFGLKTGLNLSFRFIVILSSSFLFVQVTDPDKFAVAFQQLKIPYRYSYAIILALRFVPLFNIEATQVKNAMSVRGVEFIDQRLSITRTLKIFHYTFIPLIISTLNRSEELSTSMQIRGFGAYSNRTYYKKINFSIIDLITIFLSIFLILLIYPINNIG